MMYAGWRGSSGPLRSASTRLIPECWRSDLPVCGSSMTNVSGPQHSSRTWASTSDVVRTSAGSESSIMCRMRSAGYSGSIGTYMPPALSTASMPTTSSVRRGTAIATGRSGPTPSSTRRRARRLADALSSA